MRMPRAIPFVLLAASLPAAPLTGQVAEPCPDPEGRAFDFFVGDWEIEQRILRADGGWLELGARTSVSPALDGCALVERWEGEVQFFWEGMEAPEAMQGLSVRAWDPEARVWSIHWMDTRGLRFDAPYTGGFEDGRGEFFSELQTPEGPRRGRITFSDVTGRSLRWELAISADRGRSWTPLWIMEMHRAGR